MSAAPELGLVFIALAFRPDRGTLSLMDHLTHDPRARVQVTSTIRAASTATTMASSPG
jgi:hypothetical protein